MVRENETVQPANPSPLVSVKCERKKDTTTTTQIGSMSAEETARSFARQFTHISSKAKNKSPSVAVSIKTPMNNPDLYAKDFSWDKRLAAVEAQVLEMSEGMDDHTSHLRTLREGMDNHKAHLRSLREGMANHKNVLQTTVDGMHNHTRALKKLTNNVEGSTVTESSLDSKAFMKRYGVNSKKTAKKMTFVAE